MRFHSACIVMALGVLLHAVPSFAQSPSTSDGRTVTVAGGMDVASDYVFRGVRQNSTEVAAWPFAEFGINMKTGEGLIGGVGIRAGMWNSLHTGDTGLDGPGGQPWYESRFYGSFAVQFGRGISVTTGFTAYTSPNEMFRSVKEISFRVAADRLNIAAVSLGPYALTAFEVDAAPGEGQLDGGLRGGTYLELGLVPRYDVARVRVTFPVAVGLSVGDYYELAGTDNAFGFVSAGSVVTLPIGRAWNLRGGVEYQALGETTRAFNGGDRSRVTSSIGLRFSY